MQKQRIESHKWGVHRARLLDPPLVFILDGWALNLSLKWWEWQWRIQDFLLGGCRPLTRTFWWKHMWKQRTGSCWGVHAGGTPWIRQWMIPPPWNSYWLHIAMSYHLKITVYFNTDCIVHRVGAHWQIYTHNFLVHAPSGTRFFCSHMHIHWKAPASEVRSPQMSPRPLREILDPPLGL